MPLDLASKPTAPLEFLTGGGEMGALMRAHDWSTSPLGDPHGWPQSLRSVVGLLLNSKFPMFVAWGNELGFLYNDAYIDVLGAKHPQSLGAPFYDIWSEIWPDISPLIDAAMAGEATYRENLPLLMHRRGFDEQTWFTFSYSPVRDESGRVAGMYCACTETTQQLLAERRERAERERLAQMFEQAPGFIAMLEGPDHRFTLANAAYRKLIGGRDVLGKTAREALPEISDQGFFELLDRVYATGEPHRGTATAVRLAREDGSDTERFLDFVYQPILVDGQVTGIFVEGYDITDAHAASEALRASEARQAFQLDLTDRLRGLSDPAAIIATAAELLGRHLGVGRCGYAEIDPDEGIAHIERDWTNGSMASAAGSRRIADLGAGFLADYKAGRTVRVDDALDDQRIARQEAIANMAVGGMRAHITVPLVKDGRFVAALYVNQIEPRRWTDQDEALIREVAERTWSTVERARTQRALREAEAEAARHEADALYRAYFENTPEALFVIGVTADGGFVIEETNPAHQAGVGLSIDEVRGKRVEEVLPPAAARRVLDNYRQVVETGAIHQYREQLDLNGEGQHWDTSLMPVRDADGRIVRLIGSSRNVTRQVLAEEALRQSQKMEAMGQLTGGVSHDFNNLLSPIIGSLDLLQRRSVGGEREQRLIDGALASAEKAKTLVQRLLAFARRQPLQPAAVDMDRLVAGMADLVDSTIGPRVHVRIDVADDLPPARADANQIEMALLNLAVNARDAMPDGGTLTIAAQPETIALGHRSGLWPGRYVRLSVTDTGTGMDEATLQRAIEPFFSTKGIGKGTGLGLSMVHGLAAQLGGALAISSRPGLGTNIELWLPVAQTAADVADRPPAIAAPARESAGTALLVDDEALVRMSTADMLADLGYQVVEAGSAEEALRLVDEGLAVDLLVTDHLMPGITGTELARDLRERRPGTPVLVISGYAEVDGIAPDLPRLTKPFRQSDLAATVAELAKDG